MTAYGTGTCRGSGGCPLGGHSVEPTGKELRR